jgi:hypothetical protein
MTHPFPNFFRKKIFFGQEPPPPPSTTFLGKKIFRTSMLQLLSKDFILIFHTKFRYLAQKIDILFFARKFLTQKNDCGPIFCIFLHGPPLLLRLTFDDPPLQPCSKIVTHPPIFPSPPPFYFMTGPYITKLHLYIEIT